MKIIQSPFESGLINTPSKPEKYKKLSIIGNILWWFTRPRKDQLYRESIKAQIEERGIVPFEVWGAEERYKVAKRIEKILCENCWLEEFSFHPKDPYYIIGEFEIGDLSEVEALMSIEEDFGFTFDDDHFKSPPTFEQVVDYVIENKTKEVEY